MAYLTTSANGTAGFPAGIAKPTTAGFGYQSLGSSRYVVSGGAGDISTLLALEGVTLISNDVSFPYNPSSADPVEVTDWAGDIEAVEGGFALTTAGALLTYYGYADVLAGDLFDVEATLECAADKEQGIGFRVDADNLVVVTIYQQSRLKLYQRVGGTTYLRGDVALGTYNSANALRVRKTGLIWRVSYGGADKLTAALASQSPTRLTLEGTGTSDRFLSVGFEEL